MTSEQYKVAVQGLLIGLLPLLVVPVWAAGGVYRDWQWPLIPLAFWAWFWFWIVPGSEGFPSRKNRLLELIKSPVVWLSVLFLAYLGIQTLNSGRILTFDFEHNRWMYTSPPYPQLPSSFIFEESFEMIRWFFPALTLWVILKSIMRSQIRFAVYGGVIFAASLNAVLSLMDLILGWDSIYNLGKFMGGRPYGSFGYPNHAASFFVMMTCLGIGLFLSGQKQTKLQKIRSAICLISVLLLTAAGLGTLSRFSVFTIPLILMAGVIIWTKANWGMVCRFKYIGIIAVVCMLTVCLIVYVKHADYFQRQSETVIEEIFERNPDETILGRIVDYQAYAALKVWETYPLFGTGGWGIRYEIGKYFPEKKRPELRWGPANAHNDPIQFLAEFGLVGFGLLLGIFSGAVWRCIRDFFTRPSSGHCLWSDPLRLFAWIGFILVCAQSLIDFPFRSPAILINAVLLLHVAGTRGDGGVPSA